MPRAKTTKHGTKQSKAKKRRTVAAGVIAGKSAWEIARAAECSVRHAERIATEPETKLIVVDALAPHRKLLEELAGVAIQAIAEGMCARQGDEADHKNRMLAVQRYNDLLQLAQGEVEQQKSEEGHQLLTWEEISISYRRRTNGQDTQPRPTTVDTTTAP